MEMDPLFMAQVLFRHRRFQDCIDACEKLLEKSPTDQVRRLVAGKESGIIEVGGAYNWLLRAGGMVLESTRSDRANVRGRGGGGRGRNS